MRILAKSIIKLVRACFADAEQRGVQITTDQVQIWEATSLGAQYLEFAFNEDDASVFSIDVIFQTGLGLREATVSASATAGFTVADAGNR
jgi:hypothetical protein